MTNPLLRRNAGKYNLAGLSPGYSRMTTRQNRTLDSNPGCDGKVSAGGKVDGVAGQRERIPIAVHWHKVILAARRVRRIIEVSDQVRGSQDCRTTI